jgi:hypothetical protein
MRVLLDRACVPGPCPAVGVGGFVELPARAERRACGEAAYAREETLFVVRDACDVANAVTIEELRDADELEVMSPLVPAMPFPFRFYGEPVTQFWVSDNGYVGFSEAPPNALVASGDPDTLGDPQGSFPVRGVLPFWDNLRAGPKGVCLAVTGEAPDRVLHITWRDACFRTKEPLCAPDEGTLTFTVSLEETTDHVYVGYHTMTGSTAVIDRAQGQSATIGITDDGDAACTADQCSADGLCTDGTPCGYTEVSSKMSRPELPTVGFVPR